MAIAAALAVAAPAQQSPAARPGARVRAAAHKSQRSKPPAAALQSDQPYGPPAAAAVAPPPPTPAQMPPVPASVAYQNGLLTIAAENSTLADVLMQVRAKLGAAIDFPPGASSQRVVIHAGPMPPRQALLALLSGSGFDYVIVGSEQDPQSVQRVILTPHQGGTARAAIGQQPQAPMRQPTGDPDVDDAPNSEIVRQPQPQQPPQEQPQQQAQPSVVPRSMPPQQQPAAGTNGDQQQVKTPQQLLEELQRLQQQRQQGNQQPPVPH
jgi:hypothetical protein